jgi:hypothetical protein
MIFPWQWKALTECILSFVASFQYFQYFDWKYKIHDSYFVICLFMNTLISKSLTRILVYFLNMWSIYRVTSFETQSLWISIVCSAQAYNHTVRSGGFWGDGGRGRPSFSTDICKLMLVKLNIWDPKWLRFFVIFQSKIWKLNCSE